jgi:cell division protein FtsA
MATSPPIVVGLDAGTSKVCVVVAEAAGDRAEIVGIGTAPSRGIQKGAVVNIDATVDAIHKAVEEAEVMAGCSIRDVVVALGGGHLRSFNSHGVVAVKNGEVGPADVERVLDAARAVVLPMEREVLHVLPREFVVDEQDGIREPVGMVGVRLEAHVHVMTGAVTPAQNLMKCCQRVGLNVCGVLAGALAAAEAVLTPEEKELGVGLIDIGDGVSDLVVYQMGAVRHTAVVPLGGGHVTKDIAAGLRTPLREAEKLKLRHGCALASAVGAEETIEIPDVGGQRPRLLKRQALSKIIEPRLEEILTLVAEEVMRGGCTRLASGVVITGGTAILEGAVGVAERVFDAPVRVGCPADIGGLVDAVNSPMYSTAVGLVLHAHSGRMLAAEGADVAWRLERVRDRIAGWLREFF